MGLLAGEELIFNSTIQIRDCFCEFVYHKAVTVKLNTGYVQSVEPMLYTVFKKAIPYGGIAFLMTFFQTKD